MRDRRANEGINQSESENIEAQEVAQRRTESKRGKKKEKAARYSEPLLEIINQLH